MRLELAAEVLHGALHAQGGVHRPARAVFVGNGGTEQRHNAVARVLVDGALEAVYLSANQPEAVIHDLVHHFGIEVPGQGREAGRIGEEYGDLLALPFQGTAAGENLVGQVFGCVRVRRALRRASRRQRGRREGLTAAATEAILGLIDKVTVRAGDAQRLPTCGTELAPRSVVRLTLWTLHVVPSGLSGSAGRDLQTARPETCALLLMMCHPDSAPMPYVEGHNAEHTVPYPDWGHQVQPAALYGAAEAVSCVLRLRKSRTISMYGVRS